jgi:WG containing repeat
MLKLATLIIVCVVLCSSTTASGQIDHSEKLYPVLQGGKWGYIDRSGKVVIKPQFDAAHPFYEGIARVMHGKRFTAKEKWHYIDARGNAIATSLPINRAEDFSEGLGAVCLDTQDEVGYLCGFLNNTGDWAIQPKFYSAFSFHDGLARVATKDKTTRTGVREVYIDKTGNAVIDLSVIPTGNSDRFSEGLARFASERGGSDRLLQGFFDKSGRVVIEPKFEAADDFFEGLAAVMHFKPARHPDENHDEDFDAGFIDATGKVVIKPQFEYYHPFSEGVAFVLIRGKMGAIDKTGRVIVRPQYDVPGRTAHWYWQVLDYYPESRPWSFSEGLAVVNRRGLWGYVNKTGRFVIPARFKQAHSFSGGLALVIVGGKVGYIDQTGKYVWSPRR